MKKNAGHRDSDSSATCAPSAENPIFNKVSKEKDDSTALAFERVSKENESMVRFVEDKKNLHKELKEARQEPCF